jgi:hypothetical protein
MLFKKCECTEASPPCPGNEIDVYVVDCESGKKEPDPKEAGRKILFIVVARQKAEVMNSLDARLEVFECM